ncbi:TIGR02301 family protein [Aureimonas mangrovi]|uniref:TIGR02301 family protein n=1 Tax=Aureimonas mangrovi TaxID=2758041 RepID=UPI00163DB305|nr:TIGR02301 family protein [Aureimonas mangrovi]
MRFTRRHARSLAFAAALALAAPAAGQEAEPAPEASAEAQGEVQGPVRPSNAAYMAPMGRLAGILGSIHFLRTLCGDDNASVWRDKMNELIEAQKPNEADRRILIAQFNGGYRAFESTYRQCTPAAEVATRRYLEEGATLSREISARFGN